MRAKRRRRRRSCYKVLGGVFLLLLICIVGSGIFFWNENRTKLEDEFGLSQLYSDHAILLELETGEILAEYRANEQVYPASLTKIMTALLLVEAAEDMELQIILPEEIYERLYIENASMAGFLPGETVTLWDLLYGILLPSGAECCLSAAKWIAGSEEAFVELMNQKAAELGMMDTHFCNSTGLHDSAHVTTVKDISVLLCHALRNTRFREAFVQSMYTSGATAYHPYGLTFYSTMFARMESPNVLGGVILGGKTGYTEEAGLCLASLAQIDGKEYILITTGAKGSHETKPFHILDAFAIYNQIQEKCIS